MRPRLSRRDAEAFAVAVDGPAQGRPEPAFTDRLQELVDVADLIRASAVPTARREFVIDLRAELMSAAHEELSPVAREDLSVAGTTPHHRLASPPRLRRRLTAAASAFVVVGGTLGLVAASAQAMPGDMLYPVKRATEKFELMIQDGTAEGRALLDHAQTRLGEVESLTAEPGRDAEDLIAQTLADFTAEASAGGALLLDAYRDDRAADEIEHLRAFTADSAQRLRDLAGSLPSSAANAYTDATQVIGGLDANAYQACPTCADGQPVLTDATDLIADVTHVLDSEESSSRPDRASSESKGVDRLTAQRPLTGLELPLPTNDSDDPPADTADDPNDGADSGDDDGTSDADDPVDDTPGDVDETPGDAPIEEVSGPIQDLVEPLTDTVDGLLGTSLGKP